MPLTISRVWFTLFTMSEQQREKILACACDLYLGDGLEGFSMRKLAKAVGVTAPALYRHYESKERVLLDVVGQAYELMAQYLYRALQERTPEERFRRAGQGYLEFALDNPRLYDVLFASPDLMGVGHETPEGVEAQVCAIGRFWNDRVRECVDAGVLREQDPEAIGLTIWAHAHGLISLFLRGMLLVDEETFRGIYRASSLRVMGGLATPEFMARIEDGDTSTKRGPT